MEERNPEFENVLQWDRDWQRIKDLMGFLETDAEKEQLLSAFIIQNQNV